MMSSLTPSNKIRVGLSSNRNKNNNKPSLPKTSSRTQPSRRRRIFKTLSTTLAVSSATSIVRQIKPIILNGNDGGFGGGHIGGGSNGGGGGGDGNGGGGGFWSRFFKPAAAIADENQSDEFDSHGMPVNIAIQLNKLSGFKKYKVSDIIFFDRNRKTNVGSESDDSFTEMITIVPGGVYTKAQLQKELETLASSGMFEKVDFEGKTNADGTIGIKVLFSESTWEIAENFRCLNVGMMPQTKPVELDPDMTERERMKY
ncbi:protein TOC75 chloroplastic-like, partial [Trifolium pratense]